ncbi:UDP-4-amino-4,6-dideoxy-N-acetyl-beta-L-altrosamine N-acetyltransferase [Bacillus sp. Cr_A10]|uniref:UDP-4-amino-4, 6-dideoxy-N-acetyl-beta-L-altrosamine N-acetyltransferase n=1 Tax=Bacillus sp. Cr_A10 TaxID=3033993 RepID=UPI0023DA98AE|nr:UDP-4-amino-4,6-dideoxy-N-acetyl-beta-L-altrosamine N-acetyltransferase [Bacillus sp. Cr_A10]MDF2065814.1 UDP-4-amino-4,6-dideoxy-N-acetyl-beta-L-altrosamine N-acetyltransferase [Bacillus sp. Cr_A10]
MKLRKIKIEDLSLIMEWRMSPEVTKYMYTDPQLSIESQKMWYEKIMNNNKREKYWIIQLNGNKDVGLLSITNIDLVNKKASWAYYLGSMEARGKGLARVLECNINDYIFEVLNLNKLCCEVFEFNETVVKIHEKFGAKIEGKLVDHICKNGKYYNVICMANFKENWKKFKNKLEYQKITIESY